MSIIIDGKSHCAVCRKVIRAGERLVAFSAFVLNEKDPLWQFSDEAFHESCFLSQPRAQQAKRCYELLKDECGPERRICRECGGLITNPDDYFCTGYLTDEPSDLLYQFNRVQLHQRCVSRWRGLSPLYSTLRDYQETGRWTGKAAVRLINHLRTFLR